MQSEATPIRVVGRYSERAQAGPRRDRSGRLGWRDARA